MVIRIYLKNAMFKNKKNPAAFKQPDFPKIIKINYSAFNN